MNEERLLGIEEKRLLNGYDSSLYGFIKPNEKGQEFHQSLLFRGIDHYESILLWKKNYQELIDPCYDQPLLTELNKIEESIIFCKLGHLHLLLEQYPQALSAYQRYYTLDPFNWKDPLFLYGIGLVYFHFGAFDLAIDAFYRTIYVDPNFVRANEIHLRLGTIFKIRGNLRYSLKHYQLAIIDESNPLSVSRAHVHFQVAHLFESRGYVALAKRLYELLLTPPTYPPHPHGPYHPSPSRLNLALGDSYPRGGTAPFNVVDPLVRANALRQVGWIHHNHAPAAPGVGDSVALKHPLTPQAPPLVLAAPAGPSSRDGTAIRYLQAAIGIDPGSGQTWYYLGRCFASLGKIHDAFISYRHSIDKSEGSADTWCSIGVLYQQQNQPMDALQAYICAIQLNKKFTPAWTNLALLYETCNMPRDALTCYANAIKAGDPNPALLPRIKKLKEVVLSGDGQSYYSYKSKPPLPTIEEAWNLPIPAELTSRQNADFKIPPFMAKYIYPLLQQQRELRARLGAYGASDKRLGTGAGPPFKANNFAPQTGPGPRNGSAQNNVPTIFAPLCSINAQTQQAQSNNCSTFSNPTTWTGPIPDSPLISQQRSNHKTNHEILEAPQNGLLEGLGDFGDDDEEGDEDFMDPAVERELESLLAMDGADANTLFASLTTGTGSPSNLLLCLTSSSLSLSPSLFLTSSGPSTPNLPLPQAPPAPNTALTPSNQHIAAHNSVNDFRVEPKPPAILDFFTPNFATVKAELGEDPIKSSASTCHRHLYCEEDPSLRSKDIMSPSMAPDTSGTRCKTGDVNVEILESALHMSSADILQMCRNEASKNFDVALSNGPPPLPPPHPDPPNHLYHTTSKMATTVGSEPGSCSDHLPAPLINIAGKKQVHSQELKTFCYLNPVVIVRGLCQTLKLDLSLYSTKTLVLTHPDHEIEVRSQARFPLDRNYADVRTGRVETWRCSSTRHYMPLIRYAKYQGTSFKRALEEEKAHAQPAKSGDGDASIQEEEAKKIKDCPPFKKILFGTNVDLSDNVKWKDQLHELDKLPAFLKVSSPSNILTHIGHTVLGMNSVQLYMKVPGCRTPGHRENLNFCSVNINIGPGDTEWFAVPDVYWGAFAELCRSRRVDFLKGSWWPDLRELREANIPIYRFTQKPGDVVWVNTGTIHWVQASGWCNNIAWNVGPMTAHQYESALDHYEWNVMQQYKSLVPMVHLSWNLVRNIKIVERRFYELLRVSLFKSLKRCQLLLEFLESIDKKIIWHGVSPNEPAYYCDKCEVEVFNLLFVKEEDKKNVVHCFECARRMNPALNQFVVLQQYDMASLCQTYDNFKLPVQTPASLSVNDSHHTNHKISSSTSHAPPPHHPKHGNHRHGLNSTLPYPPYSYSSINPQNPINNLSLSHINHNPLTQDNNSVASKRPRPSLPHHGSSHPNHPPKKSRALKVQSNSIASLTTTTSIKIEPCLNYGTTGDGKTTISHHRTPACTIPSHTLMRTPAGVWVKKERLSN